MTYERMVFILNMRRFLLRKVFLILVVVLALLCRGITKVYADTGGPNYAGVAGTNNFSNTGNAVGSGKGIKVEYKRSLASRASFQFSKNPKVLLWPIVILILVLEEEPI